MTAQELRQKYFDFFQKQEHALISSASLIPENDPTVLFTTAGMHPLVPYLMGEKHPAGKRLVSAQKCIRTGDIEEVGDATHHTFFEMLGNWSLGDYFKTQAIDWSWEFLTGVLKLDPERLAATVFVGDEDAPFDEEAYNQWLNYLPAERIAKLTKKDNWWGPAGQTGPCGPDSEMFYWSSSDAVPTTFDPEDSRWVEIWNDVFMQYNKTVEGKYIALDQKNVDTGMGLERTLAVLHGLDDNYRTELWLPLINKIEELSGHKYGADEVLTKAMRVVADHIKAAVMIMGDDRGVAPANVDQGYVVRRLIRRAIVKARELGLENSDWTGKLAQTVINLYGPVYEEVLNNKDRVLNNLQDEAKKFNKTLELGLKEFNKWSEKAAGVKTIPGEISFVLFTTYGFPLEIIKELAEENGLSLDEEDFNKRFQEHQDQSRTAAAGKFKGGLADAGEETVKLHTAAHLLLAALRKVLGDHVQQKGSNITAERLRFDFSHDDKLSDEEKIKVEELVNEAIQEDLPVVFEEMAVADAKEKGAAGVFDDKYGERVKVYQVGEGDKVFSYEICGGPHVQRTGGLGRFKIQKEQSSSAGVRRIKAVLE